MTSSWLLTKRKEMGDVWSIGNFSNPTRDSLGGWEDHYIINGGVRECGPNFEAVPIGNPYGFMVCRRRWRDNDTSLDMPANPIKPSDFNGYHKFSADLYEPWKKTQTQLYDPYWYYDRVTPNESYLHANDYLAREIEYNSTGIKPVHTPGPRKYHEYGFSYTSQPPLKYDVQRLEQAYPIWKEDKMYHGASQKEMDNFDTSYMKSSVAGTW